jgi:hypothetical protein
MVYMVATNPQTMRIASFSPVGPHVEPHKVLLDLTRYLDALRTYCVEYCGILDVHYNVRRRNSLVSQNCLISLVCPGPMGPLFCVRLSQYPDCCAPFTDPLPLVQ